MKEAADQAIPTAAPMMETTDREIYRENLLDHRTHQDLHQEHRLINREEDIPLIPTKEDHHRDLYPDLRGDLLQINMRNEYKCWEKL